MSRAKQTRMFLTGIGFIMPNILGFLTFTLLPLVLSCAMAFTNWDIRLHNMFTETSVRFVGLDNFRRLFADAHFLQSLRNTLFLMMGIPVGVGGSLCAALLLSGGGQRRGRGVVLAGAGMCVGCMLLLLSGASLTPLALLIYGVAALTLAGGFMGSNTVYRTLFYFPHFTAGVATFLLWKKLYDPTNGPINAALRGPLALLGARVSTLPPAVVHGGSWLAVCVAIGVAWLAAWRTHHSRRQGETGSVPLVIVAGMLYLPFALAMYWGGVSTQTWTLQVGGLLAALWLLVAAGLPTGFPCPRDAGLGRALITNAVAMVGIFACVGMTFVFTRLHGWAMDGLEPPNWLTQYHWAKPALMIMGFWAAFGSNNMLLYLAGLSNISPELYESADIDGASGMQRFWHITWPQLAPVTFFILVMSTIAGLQGGFEQARTMTQGGPARATTTLSYYVYTEGFETGRLGYASTIAWTLFALVFAVTLFNWKFGRGHADE